jgi:hypothetical protein
MNLELDNDFPEPLILPTKLLVSKAQQNHHVDASPSISQQDKPRIPLEKILSDIDNDNNFCKFCHFIIMVSETPTNSGEK